MRNLIIATAITTTLLIGIVIDVLQSANVQDEVDPPCDYEQ